MKRKLLIALGSMAAVFVLAAIAIPLLVDADQFRPMVEREAKAALGREVKISKLELSLLQGGVVAKELTVADDAAFSRTPFVKAKSLAIGVEMLPLILSRDVRITSVKLEEPQINLVRSGAGKWNFDSLGAAPPPAKGKVPATADSRAAKGFFVQNLKIADGRLSVVQGGKQRLYEDVNIEVSNFSNNSVFPFLLEAKTPGGGSVKIEGNAGPIMAGDVAQTPMSAKLNIRGLDLAATGFVPAGSGIAGTLDYEGAVKSDGKKLHSEGKATASQLQLVKGGAAARQPVTIEYASDMDVLNQRGTLTRGDILIGQSKAKLTGNFDTRGEAISVSARLKGDNLPLDQLAGLLPAFGVILPQGSQLQGGLVNTDLQIQGPVDRLVTTGPINVSNTKLGGFNLKSRASAISSLAGMPSTSDLVIQALNSKLRVAPEGIRADGIQLVLPSIGIVSGDGVIGANNSLNFKMRAKLEGGGGLMGGMSTLSTLGQSKGELPFLIQGTTSNPVFLPDLASAMTDSIKAPVQGVQGVGGMFGGLFGKKKK